MSKRKTEEPPGNEKARPASLVAGMPPNPNAMSEDGKTIKRLSVENLTLRFLADGLRMGAQVSGGKKGAAARWGAKFEERWATWQKCIDARHRRYPDHSFNALTAAAAKHFGVSQRTIKRRCTKPKE